METVSVYKGNCNSAGVSDAVFVTLRDNDRDDMESLCFDATLFGSAGQVFDPLDVFVHPSEHHISVFMKETTFAKSFMVTWNYSG